MADKIKLRRGTASEWENFNPVLSLGEIGIETDTKKMKIGDGSLPWNNLGYVHTVNASNLDILPDGANYKRVLAAKAQAINSDMFNSKYIENCFLVAGVIRNAGSGWEFLDDSGHSPLNLESVVASTTQITVNYSRVASKVKSFLVVPDETFASMGIFCGASVGLGLSNIQLYKDDEVSGYISYNGSVWVVSGNIGNISPAFSAGKLTLTHNDIGASGSFGASIGVRDSGGAAVDVAPYFGAMGTNYSEVWIRDRAGNLITTPNTAMRFYFIRRVARQLINPSTFVSAGGNLWIFGIMEL